MKWNNLQEQETRIKVVLRACPKSLSCIMHQLLGVVPSNISSNIKTGVCMHLRYKHRFAKLTTGDRTTQDMTQDVHKAFKFDFNVIAAVNFLLVIRPCNVFYKHC